MNNDKLREVATALYESRHVSIIGDGCCSRNRDTWIIMDILKPFFTAPEPVDDKALAAALKLSESTSWFKDEACFAALDTLELAVPSNETDALGVYDEITPILTRALRAARQEVVELQEWKRQCLEVWNSWDVQAVGKLLGVPLGKPIHPAIAPGIEALKAEVKELREVTSDFIENIRRHNIAGQGEWHTATDASFRILKARAAGEGKRST